MNLFDIISTHGSYCRNPDSALGRNFKVILLHRDPRATINSLNEERQEWLPGATNPNKICGTMHRDLDAIDKVKLTPFCVILRQ